MSDLVKGGQGRSAESIEKDAGNLTFCALAFVACVLAAVIVQSI
jgi:hypothetical protein